MSREDNIAAQERVAEGLVSGNLDVIDEVMADDAVDDDPAPDSTLPCLFAPPTPPTSPPRDATRQGGFSRGFYGLWHLTTAIERTRIRNLPAPDTHHRPTLGAARQKRLKGIR